MLSEDGFDVRFGLGTCCEVRSPIQGCLLTMLLSEMTNNVLDFVLGEIAIDRRADKRHA